MSNNGSNGDHSGQDNPQALSLERATIDYLAAATSANTRRAYQFDISDYHHKFGGPLPATRDAIVNYLNWAASRISPRTIKRRLTVLRQWHRWQHHPDPTDDDLVRKTLVGIERTHGRPKRKARALSLEGLATLAAFCDTQTLLKYSRNKAALLIGYFGAFRCSELVAQRWEHIEFLPEGILITVPRSKTDQTGQGDVCPIPLVPDDNICPVHALLAWRDLSGHRAGPIYRCVTNQGKVLSRPITGRHWNEEFKALALAAKLPMADEMSSHSLRRGSTTEAARKGAAPQMLQRHGRWKSGATVLEYIEAGRRFQDCAANKLFSFSVDILTYLKEGDSYC